MSDDARPDGRILYPIPEAAHRLGIGRSMLYRLIGAGTLRSVKIGGRRLVPASALDEYAEGLERADA